MRKTRFPFKNAVPEKCAIIHKKTNEPEAASKLCACLERSKIMTLSESDRETVENYDECMPDEEMLYDLADLFKVFSDTTRIKILYAIMPGELRVADIAEAIGATQSAVSHQLRILKAARLVRFQRDGKNVLYSLADDHVYTVLAQGMNHICE